MQGKTIAIILVAFLLGFGAGFALRPTIAPISPAALTVGPPAIITAPAATRARQYFAAHLDEARQIVTGCRDGWVRGDECANAEQAVTEADGRNLLKKFTGN